MLAIRLFHTLLDLVRPMPWRSTGVRHLALQKSSLIGRTGAAASQELQAAVVVPGPGSGWVGISSLSSTTQQAAYANPP